MPANEVETPVAVDAVDLLAGGASDGKVASGGLGSYLKRMDPVFSPQAYGHSGLLNMVKTYDLLALQQEPGGNWSVLKVPVGSDSYRLAPQLRYPIATITCA